MVLPGDPGNLVTEYPEGYVTNRVLSLLLLLIDCRYNATVSGPSGNITVNGSLTYGAGVQMLEINPNKDNDALSTRLTTSSSGTPYPIHNGKRLRVPTLPFDQHPSPFFFVLQRWVICPYKLSQRMRHTTVVVQSSRCTICLGT
jgi:alpha-glucosidase